MDVAGVVESVGREVTRFEPGDEVFGETHASHQWRNGGAYAEFASIPQEALAHKPRNVTFEAAAAVPTSGIIALNNLQGERLIEPGDEVLVNGAGGGVGSIVVQLARAYGARVTGVDSTEKLEMIRGLGAEHVVDYTREDFTRRGERYDLIFDVATNHSIKKCKRVLKPEGIYILIGHDHYGTAYGRILGGMPSAVKFMVMAPFDSQLPDLDFSPSSKSHVMEMLAELLETGKLEPVVDRTYPLEAVTEAIRYLQSGRVRGKIIITP